MAFDAVPGSVQAIRPTTLVDSNVLIDLAWADRTWADASRRAIRVARTEGRVVINPLIFAEVSVQFATAEEVDDVLPSDTFEREALPYEAAFLAGKAHLMYRRRGGTRRSPLPDFYIGAHAAVLGYRLLTRDAARYRSYFPTVEVISPERDPGSS